MTNNNIMEELTKPYQITFTNNNDITAHIHDSKLQQKFFKFLQMETELDNEYLVELFEPENFKNIHKLKFSTEIFLIMILNLIINKLI